LALSRPRVPHSSIQWMRSNMSNLKSPGSESEDPGNEHSSGPNLTLIYSLIGLALIASIAVAALIVFPFYVRR
jgi:hypothetical protein